MSTFTDKNGNERKWSRLSVVLPTIYLLLQFLRFSFKQTVANFHNKIINLYKSNRKSPSLINCLICFYSVQTIYLLWVHSDFFRSLFRFCLFLCLFVENSVAHLFNSQTFSPFVCCCRFRLAVIYWISSGWSNLCCIRRRFGTWCTERKTFAAVQYCTYR